MLAFSASRGTFFRLRSQKEDKEKLVIACFCRSGDCSSSGKNREDCKPNDYFPINLTLYRLVAIRLKNIRMIRKQRGQPKAVYLL